MLRDDNHEHHEHNDHHDEHDKHDKQYGHDKYPTRNEPHNVLTTPRSDALPIDSGDLFSDPWMPGLVEVEFEKPSDSGVFDNFDDATERRKPSDKWQSDLLKVLLDNQMSTWKPSFPLTYPWSRRSEEDLEKARKFYIDRGRGRFVTFRFSGKTDVAEIAAELRKVPKIVQAKPMARLLPTQINEPLLGSSPQVQPFASGLENQWYAFRCNLPDTLEQVQGNGVVIAAIDWGFDRSHQEYGDGITLRKNIYHNSEGVGSGRCIHHGSAVLGLAGARLNSHGMAGFAPESALWAIQAGEDEVMHPEYWREAIDFVREQDSGLDRKVIILEAQTASRGNIESDLTINQAIRDAVASGIVVCVPAGNGRGDAGYDDQEPPQPIPETGSILVGATTVDDTVIGRSGDRITVYAPGDPAHDVTCTSLPERHTNYFGGTSGAVAKVAGAVALLLEADNSLTPAEVRDLLRTSKVGVLDEEGTQIPNAVLLDCEYAVYSCTKRREPQRVLTNCSAMI